MRAFNVAQELPDADPPAGWDRAETSTDEALERMERIGATLEAAGDCDDEERDLALREAGTAKPRETAEQIIIRVLKAELEALASLAQDLGHNLTTYGDLSAAGLAFRGAASAKILLARLEMPA